MACLKRTGSGAFRDPETVANQNLGSIEWCTHATNQHTLQGLLSIFNVVTEPELGHTCPDHAMLQNS